MSLLKKIALRTAVAVVGLAVLLVVGYKGGWLFAACVAALAVLALSEYYSALQTRGYRPNVHLGWLCAVAIVYVTQQGEDVMALARKLGAGVPVDGAALDAVANVHQLILFILFFCVAGTLIAQFKQREGQSAVANSAATVFGVVYVGVLFSFLLRMRYLDVAALTGDASASEFAHRMGGLLLVSVPVWACDSLAFLAGSTIGRRKLAPAISPNKTVEGSVAGLLAAVIGALIMGVWLSMPVLHCLILGLMMGVMGQIGDLAKSVLKRDIGVKDFGSIFGPHGGVIDRFDALLFNMPLVYWYFWFFWVHP